MVVKAKVSVPSSAFLRGGYVLSTDRNVFGGLSLIMSALWNVNVLAIRSSVTCS